MDQEVKRSPGHKSIRLERRFNTDLRFDSLSSCLSPSLRLEALSLSFRLLKSFLSL